MGALFSKPKVTPPKPMPDAESPGVLEAQRQKRAQIAAQGGRTSTMLSRGGRQYGSSGGGSSSGGGGGGGGNRDAYRNSLLGQAG